MIAIPIPVHPRVCGEHYTEPFDIVIDPGSSPRVRGTLIFLHFQADGVRFIPACAGNTLPQSGTLQCPPVHPRVCGEHLCRTCPRSINRGSSPRVRGTPLKWHDDNQNIRFIPACAGNTPPRLPETPAAPVHPRVCGEHDLVCFIQFLDCGSSPRVRGTPLSPDPGAGQRRFIPACAGNTIKIQRGVGQLTVHPRVCGEHSKFISLFLKNKISRQNSTDYFTRIHTMNFRYQWAGILLAVIHLNQSAYDDFRHK